jgi:hypothetical protein
VAATMMAVRRRAAVKGLGTAGILSGGVGGRRAQSKAAQRRRRFGYASDGVQVVPIRRVQ